MKGAFSLLEDDGGWGGGVTNAEIKKEREQLKRGMGIMSSAIDVLS